MKRKTLFAGLYTTLIYIIVILYMTSCSSRSSRNSRNDRNESAGEITLYFPNGTDTTFSVCNFSVPSASEKVYFTDMNGVRHTTTLDVHYINN